MSAFWKGAVLAIVTTVTACAGSPKSDAPATPPTTLAPADVLELQNWTWGQSSARYVRAQGLVVNVSSRPLVRAQAVVQFYGKDDAFLSSDQAMLSFLPLQPGQSSPFLVVAKWHPDMHWAQIRFREIGGRELRFREAAKK